jgi:hypothetical protein
MSTPDTSRASSDKRRLLEERLRSGIEALAQATAVAPTCTSHFR